MKRNTDKPDHFVKAAECLKVLAHRHRLMMLDIISDTELSVGEIAESCGLEHHVTSQHLSLLRRCGFVTGVREGHTVKYRLIEDHVRELLSCMEQRFSGRDTR